MALLSYDRIVDILSKPPLHRTPQQLEALLPWFKKKSELFSSIKEDVVLDILKNCEFTTRPRDNMIIKQGERGDCFFIIIRGTVSIYINNAIAEEEDETKVALQAKVEDFYSSKGCLDRSKLGNFIGVIEPGKSFGELALINKNCIRNASIVADETSDLVVVNRELYNRSLKAAHTAEIEEKNSFIREHSLFKAWQQKHKKLLAYSLRKVHVEYDNYIVKQGDSVDGLILLHSGQAKLVVDPLYHKVQFPNYELSYSKKAINMHKDPYSSYARCSAQENVKSSSCALFAQRRREKQRHKVEVSLIGPNEVIGDVELSLNLKTYTQSVVCVQHGNIFALNMRNFERLVVKRYPGTLKLLQNGALARLESRMKRLQTDCIPLTKVLIDKLSASKLSPSTNLIKAMSAPKSRIAIKNPKNSMGFLTHRGAIIDLYGPGTVFYRNRMREKAKDKMKTRSKFRGDQIGFSLTLGPSRSVLQTTSDELGETQPQTDINEPLSDSEDELPMKELRTSDTNHSMDNSQCQSTSFQDRETSDEALTALESRIKAWHGAFEQDNGGILTRHRTKDPTRLKRVKVEVDRNLVPGTKIILRKRSPIQRSLFSTDDSHLDCNSTWFTEKAHTMPEQTPAPPHGSRIQRTEVGAIKSRENNGQSDSQLIGFKALKTIQPQRCDSSNFPFLPFSKSYEDLYTCSPTNLTLETQGTILDLIENNKWAQYQRWKNYGQLHQFFSSCQKQIKGRSKTPNIP